MLNTQKTKHKATLIFKNCSRVCIIVYNCLTQHGTEQLWNLWSPYGIGQTIIFFALWFLSSIFFSSPNLSGRRLDVYHTLTHDVALLLI